MDHAIQESLLVPKSLNKQWFRRGIFEAWQHTCAYCGLPADTLDHVIPRFHGGMTTRNNLISCCRQCNGSKSDRPFRVWFKEQIFWSDGKENAILKWLQEDG
jgi:5-methylcytosine-specific restriction endonuclease McrA